MIICPHCSRKTHEGRHCEKCGGALPEADTPPREPPLPVAEPPRPTSAGPRASGPSPLVLDMDRLAILYENTVGSVRFQLVPGKGEVLRHVEMKLTNDILGLTRGVCVPFVDDESNLPENLRRMGNLMVGFPKMEAGSYVWTVELSFERNGTRQSFQTSFELLVISPGTAREAVERRIHDILDTLKSDNVAANAYVSRRIVDELKRALNPGEDPFRVLQKVVCGRDRAWCHMRLYDAAGRSTLPPAPPEAVTERIWLDFGSRQVGLFAGRTVTCGRQDVCDIVIWPRPGCTKEEEKPYHKISRRHCLFEHEGDRLVVRDGNREEGILRSSKCGTYWNGIEAGTAVRLGVGEQGVVSFGGPVNCGSVGLDVAACSPKSACAHCPYSDRGWCGNGRPSLILRRRDGIPETYVCFWSCLPLEEIDRSYQGVVIFRKDGAFAWCRGASCGWLVPGTSLETAYGSVRISTEQNSVANRKISKCSN